MDIKAEYYPLELKELPEVTHEVMPVTEVTAHAAHHGIKVRTETTGTLYNATPGHAYRAVHNETGVTIYGVADENGCCLLSSDN